jgi:hypothetical protein
MRCQEPCRRVKLFFEYRPGGFGFANAARWTCQCDHHEHTAVARIAATLPLAAVDDPRWRSTAIGEPLPRRVVQPILDSKVLQL